ncbi:hypothetical protein QTP70_012218 [Hemibagrus guttatus]|uniref:Uncharacterized protein n=1 Tax=Hemibagrus guttatus TaxID=175788 RepID=A0AAE0VAU7_9TELE|nr:hypothetical protein QTP70_012218 [Hemibagrus guttatus]
MEQWRTFPGVAAEPKLPQERSDNSSRRSQKTPQQHPKNCRPHLPQLRGRHSESSLSTYPYLLHPQHLHPLASYPH